MDLQIFQYHPIIGFHFIPNLRTRIQHESGGYLLRTNNVGFRCEHDFVLPKRTGKSRILLFGDSFTAGDGVSNKHRYGDLLETLIPNLEVYNFGLPGTGTDQHYLAFREFGSEYEHDLVVIAAQVENIRRVAARYRLSVLAKGEHMLIAKPYFEIEDGGLSLKNVPVKREPVKPDGISQEERLFVDRGGRMLWARSLINRFGTPAKDMVQRISNFQPLPEYDRPDGREWALMEAIFRQWAAECKTPVIIMPIPLYHYVEETASAENYQKRFAALSQLSGITVHDPLTDYFSVPRSARRGFRFEKDIHPTPAHHRLLAESLAKPILQLITQVAGRSAA